MKFYMDSSKAIILVLRSKGLVGVNWAKKGRKTIKSRENNLYEGPAEYVCGKYEDHGKSVGLGQRARKRVIGWRGQAGRGQVI